jgi:predicted glycosyltransferase
MDARRIALLIYSQDGFGLGHLRRNLNVAYRVWRSQPDVSVLVVADSPAAPFFALPPRCDFVKIPTLVKVDSGIWRSDRLSLDHREVLSNPHPAARGPGRELPARPRARGSHAARHLRRAHRSAAHLRRRRRRAAHHARAARHPRRPGGHLPPWRLEGAYEAAEQYYDGVCIYGCADVFDLVREYEFPASIAAKSATAAT